MDINIIPIEICNASFRPILSPKIPKNTPPTGRAIKAPANTPYDLINSAVWDSDGKNAVPIGCAKKPNTIFVL